MEATIQEIDLEVRERSRSRSLVLDDGDESGGEDGSGFDGFGFDGFDLDGFGFDGFTLGRVELMRPLKYLAVACDMVSPAPLSP